MLLYSILVLAAGVLLAGGTVFLILRRVGRRVLQAGLSLTAVVLLAAGGLLLAGELGSRTEARQELYLALRYLEDSQPEAAAVHLDRVSSSNPNPHQYLAAQSLLERARGNGTIAKLRLDILTAQAGESSELVRYLSAGSLSDASQVSTAAALVRDTMGVSEGDRNRWDLAYGAEAGSLGLSVSETADWAQYEEVFGQDAAQVLQMNQSLSSGSWQSALQQAAALVRENPSAENRLLLAEVVAECTYANVSLDDFAFRSPEDPAQDANASIRQERERLTQQYEELNRQLNLLQVELETAPEEERERLSQEREALYLQAEDAKRRADCIYAYRALNSIGDLNSLEAQVVRARLYFALRDYDAAKECLTQAAASPLALLSRDSAAVSALQNAAALAEGGASAGSNPEELSSSLQAVLSTAFPDLISVRFTPLTQDFATRLISDGKYQDYSIYVGDVDASQYPQIRVSISGQEEIIQRIIAKQVVVKDTHTTVSEYTVEIPETSLSSICCVVDVSGSMGGQPIEDAKQALREFVQSADGQNQLSLVTFDDTASLRVASTTDKASLLAAVDALGGGGGTNITSGIAAGAQALAETPGARYMLLMTDGQSSIDMAVVEQAVQAGITIHAIGFGDVNDALLQQIADASGGRYIRADSSSELASVYASLQGMIGNQVIVCYTVTEHTEETVRYFFLREEERNTSVRVEYQVTEGEEEPLPALLSVSPSAFFTDDLRYRQENGDLLSLSLDGERFSLVTGVRVGETEGTILEQEDSYLTVELPPDLAEGLHSVTLETADGREISFPGMVAVGQRAQYSAYLLGGLRLQAWDALLLPGDLLVLGNVYITDGARQEGQEQTLDLQVQGLLQFQAGGVGLEAFSEEYRAVDLGTEGSLTGSGAVYVQQGDAAYSSYLPGPVASGQFEIQCTGEGAALLQAEEGGNENGTEE